METSTPRLSISLLGPLDVLLNGCPPADFASDKVRALLAYLAAEPVRPHRREMLAGLLWPESPERAARASLRNALAKLRRAINDHHADPPLLIVTYQTISLSPSSQCRLDIAEFDRLLLHPPTGDVPSATDLRQALTLHRGSFMEGFTLDGCGAFEEWLTIQREHFHRRVIETLGLLARLCERQGDLEEAIDLVRRQVELEPWLEESHRRLMSLLAADGRRSEALAQFNACRQLLATALGVRPDVETVALHERIRSEAGLPQSMPTVRHRLVAPLTPLIGREREVGELMELLASPDIRLLTIIGAGGVGKSHLAMVVARGREDRYLDGVVFVALAAVQGADNLLAAVCRALGLSLYVDGRPKEQLIQHLAHRRLLLLLDNIEHLLSACGELVDLLRSAPHLTILCTSRQRLNLRGEQIYQIEGLALPQSDELESGTVTSYGALALFSDSARRSDPAFTVSQDNRDDVVSICRAVAGLPLGIILAASWIEMLSPSEIAQRIAASSRQLFDLLAVDLHDVPPRHRSLRAVVDSVWEMLSTNEQEVFAGLSIFRGSFTFAAAQAVTGTTLQGIRRLVAKSVVQPAYDAVNGSRYAIHEYLRQYGYERLQAARPAERVARERHAGFYMATLHAMDSTLKGAGQQQAFRSLTADGENIHMAWQWSAEHGLIEQLSVALDPLCRLYEWQGRGRDGEAACAQVVDRLSASDSPAEQILLARAYAWQGMFSRVMGHTLEAKARQDLATEILDTLDNAEKNIDRVRATVNLSVGLTALYTDDLEAVQRICGKSRRLFRDAGDRWGEAQALEVLGWASHNRGRYEACLDECCTALAIRRRLGDTRGVAASLMGVGMASMRIGQFVEGRTALQESVEAWRACGDRRSLAGALSQMATLWAWMGEAERGCSYSLEARSILHDLGMPMWLAVEQCSTGAEPYLHSGRYDEASGVVNEGLVIARSQKISWPTAAGLVRLAKVALARQDYETAVALLQESIPILDSIERVDEKSDTLIALATSLIRSGETEDARPHLSEGMKIAVNIGHYAVLCHGIAAAAQLSLAQGDAERALERYGSVANQPFVRSSRWFVDVYGQEIEQMVAPPSMDPSIGKNQCRCQCDLGEIGSQILAQMAGRVGNHSQWGIAPE